MKYKFMTVFVAVLVLAVGFVHAAGEISSCADDPDSPGTWVLTRDIEWTPNPWHPPCLDVQSDGVTIDCQGHSIRSLEVGQGVAITARTSAVLDTGGVVPVQNRLRNINVLNCHMFDVQQGIIFDGVNEGIITQNTVRGENDGAYTFIDSNDLEIESNYARRIPRLGPDISGDGISLTNSDNSEISFNLIEKYASGLSITGPFSVDHSIHNNEFGRNVNGIALSDGTLRNTLHTNKLLLNDVGLNIVDSEWNLIYNNLFSSRLNNVLEVLDDIQFEFGSTWAISPTTGTNIVGGDFTAGNLWHDYEGEDLNGDGIGDTLTPYNKGMQIGSDRWPLWVPHTDCDGEICISLDEPVKSRFVDRAGQVDFDT